VFQQVQVPFQEKAFKHCENPTHKQYQVTYEKNIPGLDFFQVIPVQ
jgi:hypothetical protein